MSCFLGGCGQGWLGPLCRVVGALLGVGWYSGSGTPSSARAEVAVLWRGSAGMDTRLSSGSVASDLQLS